jgi:cell division protease FtsH
MVMDFGMSRLGRVAYRESRRPTFLAGMDEFAGERTHSEQTAREIDEEIRHIVAGALEQVRHILATRRPALVALSERLIEQETIDNAELKRIIEANSPSPMIVPGTEDAAPRRTAEEAAAPPREERAEGVG